MPDKTQTNAAAPAGKRRIWPDELAFDEAVYAARLSFLQNEMARRDLAMALLFDPENMFWLTGYQTIGYFTFQAMCVPATGKPMIVSRVVNRDMALALPTIADMTPVTDTEDHADVLLDVLGRTQPHGQIGLETTSRYLNVHDFGRLSAELPVRLEPFNGVLEAERMIKTAPELDRMRAAARAVEAGMEAALAAIAPGKTDNDLAAALYHGSIAAGSEYIGHPPMVVTGPRSALCFALWKRKQIEVGDVVLLEGAGCVDRYHAMMARSAVVGRANAAQKDAAAALIAVLETATGLIRPGISAAEVDHACRSSMEARGMGAYYKSRTAYGIGIGFPPNWAEGHIYAIRAGDPLLLRPGMTFHIIPTVFTPEFGMAISDSVVVSEDGCELLTNAPRDLLEVAV